MADYIHTHPYAGSGLSGFKGDALTSEALELCVQVRAMHD